MSMSMCRYVVFAAAVVVVFALQAQQTTAQEEQCEARGVDRSEDIQALVANFQKAADFFKEPLLQSWTRFVASEKDTRSPQQAIDDARTVTDRFPYLEDHREDIWDNYEVRDGPRSLRNVSLDLEEHIDEYFSMLAQRCNRIANVTAGFAVNDTAKVTANVTADITTVIANVTANVTTNDTAKEDTAKTPTNFVRECFDSLQMMVSVPTCTSQMDSRYICRNSQIQQENNGDLPQDVTAEDLIQTHFQNHTINIVIIGAGPVGLHFANVLTQISGQLSDVRILMFENRTYFPGRKNPYTRNWLTDVTYSSFEKGDPRILRIFDELHASEQTATPEADDDGNTEADNNDERASRKVHLPIMMLETLLLLSNRDRGVKFLYDDFVQYKDLLAKVSNLLVVDATGHRLSELDRGTAEIQAPSAPVISERDWAPNYGSRKVSYLWQHLHEPAYNLLKRHKQLIRIATRTTNQGNVTYPLNELAEPFVLRFLKVSDFFSPRRPKGLHDNWFGFMKDVSVSESHPLCAEHICISQDIDCHQFCALAWLWDVSHDYHESIFEKLKTTHPGLITATGIVSLTNDQYDAFKFMLKAHGGFELRLFDIPVDEMLNQRLFAANNMIHTIRFFASWQTESRPFLSLFAHTPYMYDDVLVPMEARTEGRIGDAPLIRIGDSLFSGHPNLGSGLNYHLHINENFAGTP